MPRMPARGRFRLQLAKETFKFSAAHFTLLGEDAEHLHGHNYRVAVEVTGRRLDADGLLVGFANLKALLREVCERLDDRVLVPTRSPRLLVAQQGEEIEVRWGDRVYRFPAAEVMLLPLENSSIELLARMLWEELAAALRGSPLEELTVWVEETSGQRCGYQAPLHRAATHGLGATGRSGRRPR